LSVITFGNKFRGKKLGRTEEVEEFESGQVISKNIKIDNINGASYPMKIITNRKGTLGENSICHPPQKKKKKKSQF
jgi:hypothetical protein